MNYGRRNSNIDTVPHALNKMRGSDRPDRNERPAHVIHPLVMPHPQILPNSHIHLAGGCAGGEVLKRTMKTGFRGKKLTSIGGLLLSLLLHFFLSLGSFV
jgi:hypothetical protein